MVNIIKTHTTIDNTKTDNTSFTDKTIYSVR